MKQILTIGRGLHCDIVLSDATDVVSREHATLELDKSGKYYLVDISRNGTYVNGMRIMPNQRVLVSRGDVISFAHAQNLDWNRVPRKVVTTKYLIYIVAALAVLGLGIGAYMLLADDGVIEVYGLQASDDFFADDYRYDGGSNLEDEAPDANEGAAEEAPKQESKPAKKSEQPKAKPKSEPTPAKKEEAKPAEAEAAPVEQPQQDVTPDDSDVSAKDKREAKRAAKAAKAAAKKKVYDAIY
jgi:hypothetical protein